MTEREWLACCDIEAMCRRLQQSGITSRRKRLLFSVACLRRLDSFLLYPGLREGVDVLERIADGLATEAERSAALGFVEQAADAAGRDFENIADPYSGLANAIAATQHAAIAVRASLEDANPAYAAQYTAHSAATAHSLWFTKNETARWPAMSQEHEVQANLLRDLHGVAPFRPLASADSWRTTTALAVAQTIYTARSFEHLPILADALEDAGCTNSAILDHCRQPGEHVRGCWVVDLVLGKS